MDEFTDFTPSESIQSIPSDVIRFELEQILESPSFRSSLRSQAFLRYVVEQTMTGTRHGIKERTIGVELFGRSPSYDTSSDGIVRIKASEVRKRLALYYANTGKDPAVHITLPLGSYLPSITRAANHQNNVDVPSKDIQGVIDPSFNPEVKKENREFLWRSTRTTMILIASLFILAVAMLSAGWVYFDMQQSASSRFWQPLTNSSEPISIITSYTPVYLHSSDPSAMDAPYKFRSDRYVGGGDLVAAVLVSSMLTDTHHAYSLKIHRTIILDDVLNKPTILIGYASTQWLDITKNFRFFIQRGMVTDRGQDTDWRPHHQGDDIDADYAVISRSFDPETHSMIVLVSGCTGYGTEEAARLVTDPKLLGAALSHAPKGWQQKNLQLVLHVDVIGNSPANAQVVSSYYW